MTLAVVLVLLGTLAIYAGWTNRSYMQLLKGAS